MKIAVAAMLLSFASVVSAQTTVDQFFLDKGEMSIYLGGEKVAAVVMTKDERGQPRLLKVRCTCSPFAELQEVRLLDALPEKVSISVGGPMQMPRIFSFNRLLEGEVLGDVYEGGIARVQGVQGPKPSLGTVVAKPTGSGPPSPR